MLMSCQDGGGASSCLAAELTWHLQIYRSPCGRECEIRLAPVLLLNVTVPDHRTLTLGNDVNLIM